MLIETGSTSDSGMRCRGGVCGCLESSSEIGRGAESDEDPDVASAPDHEAISSRNAFRLLYGG
jgi:hypothetical protein